MDRLTHLIESLEAAKTHLNEHPMYDALVSLTSLRVFMSYHVFAVWDFMNVLTALQTLHTSTRVPWYPPLEPVLAYLVNAIKLEEESDRIDGICRLVNALGGDIKEYEDGFDIRGPITSPQNIHFDAHYDHRLAMSGLIAAKAFGTTANIEGKDSISTSFPNFLALLDAS